MKKVIFALAICATIISCQKDDDTKTIDVSKTVYLMDKGWQIKMWTKNSNVADPGSNADSSYFSTIDDCEKDNYIVFTSASRMFLFDGQSKCDQTAPDSTEYGYTLSNGDNHINIFTDPNGTNPQTYVDGEMKYLSIDTFTLTYRLPDPNDNAITQEFVRTYVKQ